MHLTFLNKQIREICEKERVGRKRLGDIPFEELKARLADLLAAQSMEELPIAAVPFKDRPGELAIDLTLGLALIVMHNQEAKSKASKTATLALNSIKLLRIEDKDGNAS